MIAEVSKRGSIFSRGVGRTVFGTDISGYHEVRPGYPGELFEAIDKRVPRRNLFGEIGSGTGLATEALLGLRPTRLVAFEPDAALGEFLSGRFPSIQVIEEDFCAADVKGPFDLIAAAASFHWLDPEIALRKIHELLRPEGCLAIWWNVYREAGVGDLFAEAVTPLLLDVDLPPSQSLDHHYGLDKDVHFERLKLNGFVDLEYHLFRRERVLSPAEARALYASFSLVRVLPETRREALLDSIAELVVDQFRGAAPSVLLTPFYLATKPAESRD